MKVDQNVINARVSKIREYIKILEEIQDEPKQAFMDNYKIYGLAERYLHLAIECVLDIGNHLISRLELQKPNRYQEIFLILGKNSILPMEFAVKIAKMAGFRNILIHSYLEIDRELVYEHLHHDISDFNEYIKYIIKYIKEL